MGVHDRLKDDPWLDCMIRAFERLLDKIAQARLVVKVPVAFRRLRRDRGLMGTQLVAMGWRSCCSSLPNGALLLCSTNASHKVVVCWVWLIMAE